MQPVNSLLTAQAKVKIVAAINQTDDIAQATEATVNEMLVTTLEHGGKAVVSMTAAIADVANGAIRGAMQIDADLEQAAKGIMIGIVRASATSGPETVNTISHIAQITIGNTAAIGGDLEAVTAGLVIGAINCATTAGVSAAAAATAAATGALTAAVKAGSTTLALVHQAVTRTTQRAKDSSPPL